MPIPLFDPATGYLPPGLHLATEAEVGNRLGSGNPQRNLLFEYLQRLLTAARRLQALRLFIDGSFVTDKERLKGEPPQDIDCALWLPGPAFAAAYHAGNPDARFLFGLHLTRKVGLLDLYLAFDQGEWDRWVRFFGSDDEDVPKGCVEVAL